MTQATVSPTRGKLLKEPKIRALQEVKFPLRGQWLPIGAEKMCFFDMEDLERQVPKSEDPELHDLVGELLDSEDAAHVWVDQIMTQANFYVQLKPGLTYSPTRRELARINRVLEKYRA